MSINKSCLECENNFEVDDRDLKFYDRVSPIIAGKKYSIPPPSRCPDCRQQRRLALANERFFYSAKCGLCSSSMLTEHPPHSKKISYCRECWHSDKWDPLSYGNEIDFTRPVFEQLKELWLKVPAQNLLIEGTNENSEYIHYAGFAKNCYLIMHADFCEDCYYGYGFKKNICCVDGFYNLSCELCYDCIDIHSCYELKGSQDCINCSSSAFLRDCIGCKSCFLCVGLRNKEYCFENRQLSKAEYQAKMALIDLGKYSQYQFYRAKRAEFESQHTFKEYHGHNIENCFGDYISNSKDLSDSFDCEDVEDGRYLYQVVTGAKSDYDIYQYGLNLAESYECSIAGNNGYHLLFCHNAHVDCRDLLYCWYLHSSKNCFGCISMHHKEYCIFNKQYSKSEYEKLVPSIIELMMKNGEWGEMFPITFSPFGYNKTSAQMYYPMLKQEVLDKGWVWDGTVDTLKEVEKAIQASELPDSIIDFSDSDAAIPIYCEVSGKPFKLTQPELKFYRKNCLPIPRRSPDQRHLDRFHLRNQRRFWERKCGKCLKEINTTYNPTRSEKVYCEKCYQAAIY